MRWDAPLRSALSPVWYETQKKERWVEWMCTVSETAGKWFICHCNDIPWCAQGCTSCSKHNNHRRTRGSIVLNNPHCLLGQLTQLTPCICYQDRGQDACYFILSNSSVTYERGHIHPMDHSGEWVGFSDSNASTWHVLAEGTVFVLT